MPDYDAIHDLFGSFRAEWLRDDLFRLFSEPTYFAHLVGDKSCVLMGGRGSGKTTALRCLAYEGQEALGKFNLEEPNHVGVYYRINTNIVTAFDGPELSDLEWRRLFGHFINLTICYEFANYVKWQTERSGDQNSAISFASVATSLGLSGVDSIESLLEGIEAALGDLEIYVNNLGLEKPTISQLQSPINRLLKILKNLFGHEGTSFYIILDEYENLLDYQQRIVNTLLKHSGDNCYFKIGVRELGLREHTTLNENESLISPADYELIHIEERLKDEFPRFAQTVCESRLSSHPAIKGRYLQLDELLPTLSALEESERLGVARRVSGIKKRIRSIRDAPDEISELHDFIVFSFYELNQHDFERTLDDLKSYLRKDKSIRQRFENHSHALLFSISDKGTPISKHYCGHKTFARLANGNIRFYMQLVHESIVEQLGSDKDLECPIDCREQTMAARRVGQNYLRELEGVTARGSHLSRLILGLGRFFQILAANPVGGSPEKNQFSIRDSGRLSSSADHQEASKLLKEAVMHLALVRSPGTKLLTETDTHAWDYSPHPIFAPYFTYSSRRKRKAEITDADLIAMSKAPQDVIKRLLGQTREHLANSDLPPQMSMFDEFFS